MAKFDVTVRQTPHDFSDSPGTFLPLAAICRKIKYIFISFLFHVPATLKDDTVFSCALIQEVWAVKIYVTLWLILSASNPSDLQSLKELGRIGAVLIEKGV